MLERGRGGGILSVVGEGNGDLGVRLPCRNHRRGGSGRRRQAFALREGKGRIRRR